MKQEELQALNEELRLHIREVYNEEIPMVFGNGDMDSPIALIGEAPGKNEILQGKPFVGQAGKNLDEFIEVLQIDRKDLYITNVVKLRPFKINESTGREANRTPNKKEISLFTPFLMKELEHLVPRLIVTLGNIALKCITQDDEASIGNLHGRPMEIKFGNSNYMLFPLYHPASIIYKAELKETYMQDLHKLRDYIRSLNII